MKERKIIIRYEEYNKDDILSTGDSLLVEEANQALKTSYAPYSEFHVGAAVLLENGKVIKGSNQENSAYPSGLCAERVAIFHAKASFPDEAVIAVAITGCSDNFTADEPITPCGACREVIAETEKRQSNKIRIIMSGSGGCTKIVDGIDNLLPMKFHEEKLKKVNLKK